MLLDCDGPCMTILLMWFWLNFLPVRMSHEIEYGFMAEYIESVDENHEHYVKPPAGHTRPKTKLRNLWLACGPNATMLMQVGILNLPMRVSKWLVSSIGFL